MTFHFDFVPEDELDPFKLIAEGEGTFKITAYKEGFSKAQHPMLTLNMLLKDAQGRSTLYNENITAAGAFKIKAICDAIGKPQLYSSAGTINPHMLLGEKGTCMIATDRPTNPQWKERSMVARYIKAPIEEHSTEVIMEIEDDTIPF